MREHPGRKRVPPSSLSFVTCQHPCSSKPAPSPCLLSPDAAAGDCRVQAHIPGRNRDAVFLSGLCPFPTCPADLPKQRPAPRVLSYRGWPLSCSVSQPAPGSRGGTQGRVTPWNPVWPQPRCLQGQRGPGGQTRLERVVGCGLITRPPGRLATPSPRGHWDVTDFLTALCRCHVPVSEAWPGGF